MENPVFIIKFLKKRDDFGEITTTYLIYKVLYLYNKEHNTCLNTI